MRDESSDFVNIVFEVNAASQYTRLGVVGNAIEIGSWQISKSIQLSAAKTSATSSDQTTWRSVPIKIPIQRFPLKLRIVANGHRSSPNTRPLVWDLVSRLIPNPPPSGVIALSFDPSTDNSDSGWVHSDGVGAYQLRVGRLPGSQHPLVRLLPEYTSSQGYRIHLYEARGRDPAVPEGKSFARITYTDMGFLRRRTSSTQQSNNDDDDPDEDDQDSMTFILNAQSLDALEFRVDVVSGDDGSLIARGYLPAQALLPLEGSITIALLSPAGLHHAGYFHAVFLVVTELNYPTNHLGGLQRSTWRPNRPTLDVGHRGSGSSKTPGHSVRENTLLSFAKAALNHSDYIEFDVHVTADNEVVIHHDFEVKIALDGGDNVVKLALPLLHSKQLQSESFSRLMITPTEHNRKPKIDAERAKRERTLKRTMTSGEDLFHSIFDKSNLSLDYHHSGTDPPVHSASGSIHHHHQRQQHSMSHNNNSNDTTHKTTTTTTTMATTTTTTASTSNRAFLRDTTASLREAFRSTPRWLGFNIEVKYPTEAEMIAMGARFYSRSSFVDTVLRVVLDEGNGRPVIFSTFDPDCATLLRLKQPRFPVFFLTCGGTKQFMDPRMNSLDAALQFAVSSRLQGVVAEVSAVMGDLEDTVEEFHRRGLFLFTWGDGNNDLECYTLQKTAGVDAIIMDDVARIARATQKQRSRLFGTGRALKSPPSLMEPSESGDFAEHAVGSMLNIVALDYVGSPVE